MVSVIVAVARNGVIGAGNQLIWHIGEDLKRFKAITSGHPVVMGRKTFESLGRPLPNRTNVVVTRNAGYSPEKALAGTLGGALAAGTGATGASSEVAVASSLEEAIAMFPPSEEIFIIGGGEIYRQAMPLADRFYPTVVEADYDGDTFYPEWNRDEWIEESRESHPRGEKFDKPFTFIDYRRKPGTKAKSKQ